MKKKAKRADALDAAEAEGERTGEAISEIGEMNGESGGASFNSGAGEVGGQKEAFRIIGREAGRAALDEYED